MLLVHQRTGEVFLLFEWRLFFFLSIFNVGFVNTIPSFIVFLLFFFYIIWIEIIFENHGVCRGFIQKGPEVRVISRWIPRYIWNPAPSKGCQLNPKGCGIDTHLTPSGRSRMIWYVFVCSLVMINWRWMLGSAGARGRSPSKNLFFQIGDCSDRKPPTTTNHWSWHLLTNTSWNPLVLYIFLKKNLWTLRNSGLFPWIKTKCHPGIPGIMFTLPKLT